MKVIKKIAIGLFVFGMVLATTPIAIKAAYVSPGGTFTATLACGFYEGYVTASGSNASVTSISGNGWCDRGGSVSATATAGSSGTASISITSVDVVNVNTGQEIPAGTYLAGSTVTIGTPPSNAGNAAPVVKDDRSTNANLASLTVSQGTLTPAFDANTSEYSVSLSAKTTSIKVDATLADTKAKLSGTGEHTVKAGENIITITVTAENQTTKAYTIKAIVDEKPFVYTTFNNTKLGVVRNIDGVQPPATFEKGNVTLGGKEIPAWISKAMNKTLVYLVDESNNEKNFYIYDEKTKKITSIFKPTSILGRNFFIVDIEKDKQKLEGLTYKKVTIDKTEMMGWKFNDKQFENYNLIYVMDENGKMQYYQYEKTQNTLQLYSKAAPITQESYEQLVGDLNQANTMKMVFIILTAILAVFSVLATVVTLKMRTKIK